MSKSGGTISKLFQNAVVLTGPTGVGKSAAAIALAKRWGGEIVSMDSMAVYRGMDIGTAKPSAADRADIPHHLIDVLDPWQSATVAWWLDQADECCRAIENRSRIPIFVGGTPLYLKAMLYGLFKGPPADHALRDRLQHEAEANGVDYLHQRLQDIDPATAQRLHPNDVRRVIRALEVWQVTGKPLSVWQQQWRDANVHKIRRCWWLDLPREQLYNRINSRVDAMFTAGLVDEVRALSTLPKPLSREAKQALGYKEVLAYLNGERDLADTIVHIQTRTRNFAKRQITWFRHLQPVQRITNAEAIDI